MRPPPLFSRSRAAALGAPILVLTGASVLGTVLAPALLGRHPLFVAVLCPRSVFLVAAARRTTLPVFVALGLLRLSAAGPSHFFMGRRWGPTVSARLDRGPRPVRFTGRLTERLFRRAGPLALVASPTGKVVALASASDVSTARIATAVTTGVLLWLLVFYAAAHAVR